MQIQFFSQQLPNFLVTKPFSILQVGTNQYEGNLWIGLNKLEDYEADYK